MALIKCPDCGTDVSDKAKACPKCGRSPSRGSGKRILKWGLLVILAVPVLAISAAWLRNKAVGPEGWLRDNAEKSIKARLIDPDSFVIRDAYYVRRPFDAGGTLIALCGVFDAKNRMGGFTGGTRFVALGVSGKDSLNVISVEFENTEKKRLADGINRLSSFETVYWNESCVDAAHPALVFEKNG